MAKASAKSRAKRVLLVDDDPDIVDSMKALLESSGYEVLTASDGNAGLAVAEQEQPDLIVLDMMLPKRSGFLVLEKLKRSQGSPPIIMITGNEGVRHQTYAETLGVDEYMRKPFRMERLLERIEELLK